MQRLRSIECGYAYLINGVNVQCVFIKTSQKGFKVIIFEDPKGNRYGATQWSDGIIFRITRLK